MIINAERVTCTSTVSQQGNIAISSIKAEINGYVPQEVIRGLIEECGKALILQIVNGITSDSIRTVLTNG